MDKIIKLPSKQGNLNTTSKNLIDFVIPRGDVYDLSKSYVNINVSINTTDTVPSPPDADESSAGKSVFNTSLNVSDGVNDDKLFPSSVLVKNAFIASSNIGKMEDLRDVDKLRTTLDLFESDFGDVESRGRNNLGTVYESMGLSSSPYRDMTKLGSQLNNPSSDLAKDIRIPLSSVFNCCSAEVVDCNKYGDIQVHLEANFDKLITKTDRNAIDGYWALTQVGQTEANQNFVDVAHDGNGAIQVLTTITTARGYARDLSDSPYYCNQRLQISGTYTGAGAVGGTAQTFTQRGRIISEIRKTLDANGDETGQLDLILDHDLVSGLGTAGWVDGNINSIVATGDDPATATIEINGAEMVLHVLANPPPTPPAIEYYTYLTEHDEGNGRTFFNKNYQLEAETANCYIHFSNGFTSDIGAGATLDSYRVNQDGVEQTNRKVKITSAIHQDTISKTYINNGRPLKNLTQQRLDNTDFNVDANFEVEDVVMFPVNLKDSESILSVEMEATGNGVGHIILYKEVVRSH